MPTSGKKSYFYNNALITIISDGSAEENIALVEQETKKFLDHYNGNIPIEIVIGSNKEAIYGKDAEERGIEEFQGAFHRVSLNVSLAASNLFHAGECETALRHEVLGHFGLLTLRSEEKIELLNGIAKTRKNEDLKHIWDYVDRNYKHLEKMPYALYHKSEEVFAFVVQKPETFFSNSWENVRAIFSKVLRKCGLVSKELTMSELRVEALKISEGIRNGTRKQQIFPNYDDMLFNVSAQQTFKKGIAYAKKLFPENQKKQVSVAGKIWQHIKARFVYGERENFTPSLTERTEILEYIKNLQPSLMPEQHKETSCRGQNQLRQL
jgi:hypothetical protein